MICDKCKTQNRPGATFCSNCGNKLVNNTMNNNQPVYNNQNYNYNNYQQKYSNQVPYYNNNVNKRSSFTKGQKITIIGLLSVIIIVFIALLFGNGNGSTGGKGSRTIMIYTVGSNLEYSGGIATADLESIDRSKIDYNKTNILIYTGGTKEWLNDYISNEENAIFILTKDGYKKLETYEKKNMGDPNTLSGFMQYAYNNYKTEKYDLIMYDHGGAMTGAINDDFTGDTLSITDIITALKDSPFNENNKMESVLFRTCLCGTLEIATIFEPYSEYIAFSEEVSWGSARAPVFQFMNLLTSKDNGQSFGTKFVDGYLPAMKKMDPFGSQPYTYSVIDLSKIKPLIAELDNFIGGIDVTKNYNEISKIRANLYQYGMDHDLYDMVDLYTFIKKLSPYSTVSPDNVYKAIEAAVVKNETNLEEAKGLSIYFPYKATPPMTNKYLNIYKVLNTSEKYRDFITGFNDIKNKPASFSLSFTKNEMTIDDSKEVSLKLSEEQAKYYSRSRYVVFRRDEEHKNYYKVIYIADDATLSEDGVLSTHIGNNLLKIGDKEKDGGYIPLLHISGEYYAGGMFYDKTKTIFDNKYMLSSNAFFMYNDKEAEIASATVRSNADERVEGMMIDLQIYNYVEIWSPIYKIHDKKGNFTLDWEAAPEYEGFGGNLDELIFTRSTIDNDGEYYVAFNIYDVNNESYASKLIKVGK